ncbi:MAG: zinc ribbon domain-containing protein [Thermoanaerobacterales bacterium]|jgi:putative FmdB family regulatory protein|nr:zinc ribbon domain-containing protein [Thermoanaerobacterales bacterium]
MPTFDFKCCDCGHNFSEFVSIKDKEKVSCPKCGGRVSQRFTGFCYFRKGGNAGSSSSSCSGGSCSTCSGCS